MSESTDPDETKKDESEEKRDEESTEEKKEEGGDDNENEEDKTEDVAETTENETSGLEDSETQNKTQDSEQTPADSSEPIPSLDTPAVEATQVPAAAEEDMSRGQSRGSVGTDEEEEHEKKVVGEVVYEWEQELEEYDEPDIYPSDKDYIWVEELVEVVEELPPPPPPPPPEIKVEEEQPPPEVKAPEEGQAEVTAEAPAEESKEVKEGEAPAEDKAAEKKEGEAGEEAEEQAEDVFIPGAPEQEAEPEPEGPPQKKFKSVMVRKLVERPPKIHYEPKHERRTHFASDDYDFPVQPFSLVHSYGYDSQRMANVHVLDDQTLVYMSGFVITLFNHVTSTKTYLRCIGGSCFGGLAVHASRKLFAAAEKGHNPLIGIWSWPKLQLFRQLREGTNKIYASVNFSPDGTLLASQGGEPDYLVTVWNWLAETPVLRVKSHAQDVYRVTFSRELAGRLTTSGLCHIKFWKMASTFTGLKLKGDLGRFGRTELSDIEGYVEMPDGKVVSGSEWGNMLVWDNGLIVAELCIKNDVPCHEGIVRQILLHEGEFYTTGQDGWVKTWNFDSVDTAEINTNEESLKVPLKVIAQVQVGDGADIWSIVQDIPDPNSNSVFWFAQDGRGAIYKVDLSFLNTAKDPSIISTAHGGPIVGCEFSFNNCLLATLGIDGQIRVYNYITHELVARGSYAAAGSCFLWPSNLNSECTTLIAGFADGTFRVIVLSGIPNETLPLSLTLQQVRKPHGRRLTCMELHQDGRYFVTGGEDGIIFFFDARNDFLPMAFIQMPDWKPVRIIKWARHISDMKVLVALDGGTIQEVQMPEWEEIDNETSYFFVNAKLLRRLDFMSVKSVLRHNEELERERLFEESRIAGQEEENRQRIADGLETQSEQDIRLLQEAEQLDLLKLEEKPKQKWEPYIPAEASPILLMVPSAYEDNEILLSMGKYDAGYFYLLKLTNNNSEFGEPNKQEPIDATPVPDSDDVPITAMVMNYEGDIAYMGFEDGRIRAQKLNFSFDIGNLGSHWTEGFHDCIRGSITSIALEKNNAFLLTCGNDGNCFLHSLMREKEMKEYIESQSFCGIPETVQRKDIQDIIDPNAFTLETSKSVEKELALLATAKRNKTAKREEIVRLRLWFCDIIRRNSELPDNVRLSPVELIIHNDTQDRRQAVRQEALQQLEMEMAWENERCHIALNKLKSYYKDVVDCELFILKAFNSPLKVSSFRLPKLHLSFYEAKDMILNQRTPRGVESDVADDDASSRTSSLHEVLSKPKKARGMDKFVYQRLVRLWERKQKKAHRNRVWKEFLATEPKGKELREEDRAIEEARSTMGDMKLKTALDYKVPDAKKLTEHRARKRLVFLEELMFEMKKEFNDSLLRLREHKVFMVDDINKRLELVREQHKLLPPEEVLELPPSETMGIDENPKSFMDYTRQDIRNYKTQIAEKLKAATSQPSTQVKAKLKPEAPQKRKQFGAQVYRKVSSSSKIVKEAKEAEAAARSDDEGLDLGCYVETVHSEPTALEKQIHVVKIEKARHCQNYNLKKMREDKFIFDARLKVLRHRKLKLDYLLKLADERMVLLTEEFLLAKRSVAMEATMEMRMADANRERKDCGQQVKTLAKKQDGVKRELENYAKQRAVLLQEVIQIATKAPGFEKYLVRVFNKKISKPKAKAPAGASVDDVSQFDSESEDSESSSDMDMDVDEDEDDDLDVDLPPPELNKDIYDQVVEIRGKRVVIDDAEQTSKDVYDEVAGAINQLKNRINAADKELDRVKKDVEVFSKEKQQHLNNLDCTVSLKPHQIFLLDKDFSNALVTEDSTIKRLQQRIPELRKEKKSQRKKATEVKKTHRQLQREKHKFENLLEEMSKRCDVEMVKKFGVICSIDVLENFSGDLRVLSLRSEMDDLSKNMEKEMFDLKRTENETEKQRQKELNKQTARSLTKADIIKNISTLTHEMDEELKHLPSEFEDTTTRKEIAFLKVLVTEQWEALRVLTHEIQHMTTRRTQPLPPIKPSAGLTNPSND